MALQKFGASVFPLAQQHRDLLRSIIAAMTLQQARGRRRRPGAAVKLDHRRLSTGEELVQHRQIADNDSDETKTGAGLQNGEHAAEPGMWHHVAVPRSEERHAAHIQLITKLRRAGISLSALSGPQQEAETQCQTGAQTLKSSVMDNGPKTPRRCSL
jgi:hypothetical protein